MAAAPSTASTDVAGFAALEPGLKHDKVTITLPALGPTDVRIKITHCGVCHSDIHLCSGEWGAFAQFPQTSGHEIVGIVEAKGDHVTHLEEGQRVGVGWYRESCRTCELCLGGRESTCADSVPTAAGGNKGGFAEAIVVPSDFAFRIPDGLASEHAAPLFCGGITVYSPLVDFNAVGKRVGVVGIGGLGSMAIQFAKARGNYVVALSSSADKEALCKELGADAYINTKEAAAMKGVKESLDLLIVALNVALDFNPYIDMLKPHGAIVFVGAIPGELKVPIFGPLLMKQLTIAGSATGGRGRIAHMLQFAADHGVKPLVEVFPFDDINSVLTKVSDNKVRFRAVLKW